MVLALMAFFAWGFTDPTEENEHLVKVGPAGHTVCLQHFKAVAVTIPLLGWWKQEAVDLQGVKPTKH